MPLPPVVVPAAGAAIVAVAVSVAVPLFDAVHIHVRHHVKRHVVCAFCNRATGAPCKAASLPSISGQRVPTVRCGRGWCPVVLLLSH